MEAATPPAEGERAAGRSSEATVYHVFCSRSELGAQGYTEAYPEEPGSDPVTVNAPTSDRDLLYLGAAETSSRESAARAVFDAFDPKATAVHAAQEATLDRLRRLLERIDRGETVYVMVGARSGIGPVPLHAEVERKLKVGTRP